MILRDIFYLQKNDRDVLLAIIIAMTVLMGLIFLFNREPSETAKKENDSIQTYRTEHATSQNPVYYKEGYQIKEAFPFDPNTADSVQFKRLGLQAWQIRSILHYRAKGGVYSRPSDFARVYGMTKRQYEALAPFIRIADDYKPASDFYGNEPYYQQKRYNRPSVTATTHSTTPGKEKVYSYPHKLSPGQHININTADTTELQKIPGIGSYYAKMIIKYRDRLGGFAGTEQLNEIEDFPKSAVAFIHIDANHIHKLDINKLNLNQLRKHPYLNFYQAKEICDYRRQRGPIKSLEELKLLKDFPPAEIERLTPYISF